MQIEQITTRYIKDGTIQTIAKAVWDFWTSGNPEQKVANGLAIIEVPQDLLDKPIKLDLQTMTWVDASEDEINRVKTQVKKLSDELDKTKTDLAKAQEERENAKTDSEEKQKQISEMQQTINQLQNSITEMIMGGAQ